MITMIHIIQDEYGFTALGIACQEGHIEVASLLIDYGASVTYQNKVSLLEISYCVYVN